MLGTVIVLIDSGPGIRGLRYAKAYQTTRTASDLQLHCCGGLGQALTTDSKLISCPAKII
jgi:hypothetical protein